MTATPQAPTAAPDDQTGPFPLKPRQGERRRVIRRVKLVFGACSMDAVLLDTDAHGAQCRLPVPADLPPFVALREAAGQTRRAALRWSRGDRIGLEFVTPPDTDRAPIEPAAGSGLRQRIDALWRDATNDVLVPLDRDGHFGREEIRAAAREVAMAIEHLRVLMGARIEPGAPPS